MNGFVCLNKESGPSSNTIITRLRKLCRTDSCGHTGTLDPAASGLLVCALGSAARLIPYLILEPKNYTFTLQFGTETDTLDATGIITQCGYPFPDQQSLVSVISTFKGTQLQTPPQFCANKINGVRAYKLARKGKDVQLQSKTITIESINLVSYDLVNGQAEIDVICSQGTYIRSLAKDISVKLGTVGHALRIHRTRIGAFSIFQSHGIEEFNENPERFIIPEKEALSHLPAVMLENQEVEKIKYGMNIRNRFSLSAETILAMTEDDRVAAVCLLNAEKTYYNPKKVFIKP